MATFFGEILPVISRAVEDDDEEDDIPIPECSVSVRWSAHIQSALRESKKSKISCHSLVLALGPAATGFSRTYIVHKNYEIIGGVFGGMREGDVTTLQQQSPTDKTCYIYRCLDNPGVIVCQCNMDVTPEQAYSFSTQLCDKLDLSMCYISILCTMFTAEYKSDKPVSEMSAPFLRALKTTKYTGTPLCPYLEQPNVVTGLPAQFLSYCQIKNYRAVLYACFTDSIYLDSASMKTFLPLLNSTPIKDAIEINPDADKALKHIVDLHTKHNTLYL